MLRALIATLTLNLLVSGSAIASDIETIHAKLHHFLVNVDQVDAHQQFWAEELIYTSSAGKRFDKAAIIGPMLKQTKNDNEPSTTKYSAEEVDIRVYGETAVLAFKLVARESDQVISYYLNTGTLIKRDGTWQVVAWQATQAKTDS